MIDRETIEVTANSLRPLAFKYNITPKHMGMSLLAIADLMEQNDVGNIPYDGMRISDVFKALAMELIK